MSAIALAVVLACLGLAGQVSTRADTVQAAASAGASRLDSISTRLARVERLVERPPKDIWDKLDSIAALLSGLFVAVIGFYATNIYNRRQREAEERRKERELTVSKVQTVEKFIPHLASASESTKSAALVAIAALGDEDLAVKLALAFKGSGSTMALATIASTGGSSATIASQALTDLFEYLKARVVTVHSDPDRRASGFVVSDDGLVLTTAHAIADIASDRLKIGLPDGKLAPAEVIAKDTRQDLALMRTESAGPLPAIEPTLGMPQPGTLGRARTFLVCPGDAKIALPSGLAGVTAATYAERSDRESACRARSGLQSDQASARLGMMSTARAS